MERREVDVQVSTGVLPGWAEVERLTIDAYEYALQVADGDVADYIPHLAQVDPELFAVSVAEVDGAVHAVGDADVTFSIQSISKAFVYALVCEELGHERVRDRVGVNNTGLAFNSVVAIELNDGHPMNPMVNAGAIATTALVPAATAEERWARIQDGLSAFAGRRLELDGEVYTSEADTNQRNRSIGTLLQSYGRLDGDPLAAVDVYTRQCSLLVTASDLAVMGATLADGGVNPALPTILGLVVFGIGQGALVTLVFNVLVTAVPKKLAGDVGSIRGTTQNLASAVGTAVAGALLVGILSVNIGRAVMENTYLPDELAAEVSLESAEFISNDQLRSALDGTSATASQVDEFVRINEEARLSALRTGLLVLAGISALAIVPAARLPRYRPGEIPDPSPSN